MAVAFSFLGTVIGVLLLGGIIVSVLVKGGEALSWEFLTNQMKPQGYDDAGIGNAIVGTFLITLGAALIAIPLGLLGGIFLSEYGRGTKLNDAIRFSANVMMGIPSIIVGTFVFAVIVIPRGGASGIAGSLALAIIMFPVVLRVTEDMLGMVPNALREAALSTGMPRWLATLSILFRQAKGGLLTGVLLAIARVSGETAPLLFVVRSSMSWPDDYFSRETANITVTVKEYAMNYASDEMHTRAWGAAFVIMVAVLAINIVARTFFRQKS
ncbi:MAG: phosphate ABC transporter permease PstA [Opitutales bacterium]